MRILAQDVLTGRPLTQVEEASLVDSLVVVRLRLRLCLQLPLLPPSPRCADHIFLCLFPLLVLLAARNVCVTSM